MQYDLVTIVASARGVIALRHLLAELPSTFTTPIAALVESREGLADELQAGSRLKVRWAEAQAPIEKGHVYLSRPGTSLVCTPDGSFSIAPFGAESSSMSPVDTFLSSTARVHGKRLLVLVLGGFDRDGVEGCEAARRAGATVLVLDRATAAYWGMAEPILKAGAASRVLTIVEVAEALRGCFTSQDLLRCAEIQVRLGELLETAMRLSGTRMGHVTRRTRDSDRLRIIVQRGLDLDFFERFDGIPLESETAWCRAVRYRQRVVVPDVSAEQALVAHAQKVPYRAVLAVPLLRAQPVVEAHGALTALFPHSRQAPAFQSADLDHLAHEAADLVAQVS